MTTFIGRQHELSLLRDLLKKKSSSLVVIRGRRRIGKSRLAEEYSKLFPKTYSFTGLPPTARITSQKQRDELSKQMEQQKITPQQNQDWSDCFFDLAQSCSQGPVLVILDEISWMGSKDPAFLGKLKIAWDQHFKKNPELVMILSGSNSSWIEKNILSSSGFLGRVSLRLHLQELSLSECNRFWDPDKNRIAAYEKLKILSVTGGIPRYLEEILPQKTAEDNIHRMCFTPEGFLFSEFDNIFSDLFSHKSTQYKNIVEQLTNGPLSLSEIAEKLGREKGGDLSDYLSDLCETNFVSRDFNWNIKTGKTGKLYRYRLSDNYLRFYLKHIEPNKNKILNSGYSNLPPAWHSILGLSFENLVLNNKRLLFDLLKIKSQDIILASPYYQTQTLSRKSCQIDLLIQTKFNTLYVCEIKFEKNPIGSSIIQEVQQKIDRLALPKGFSCRSVLIHVGGVTDAVIESDYFSDIIDFTQSLD
ncbi:MAG: ATP-binding protein [Myxococcaceae bacterium]